MKGYGNEGWEGRAEIRGKGGNEMGLREGKRNRVRVGIRKGC